MIRGLVDEHGVRHENVEDMSALVKDFFANLFTSEVHEVDQEALRDVNSRVTPDMNLFLLAPFSREEVKKALFSIGDLKAQGRMDYMRFSLSASGICWVMN